MIEEENSLDDPYLIVCSEPSYLSRDQKRYLDPLWSKDLKYHFPYIRDLKIASPSRPTDNFQNLTQFDVLKNAARQLDFVDLPPGASNWQVMKSLPKTVVKLWRAVGKAKIVHSDILAGWPLPYGWLAVPMAKLRGKFIVSFIEADLQFPQGQKLSWKSKIRMKISEFLARWCCKRSDLVFFGYDTVREKYLGPSPKGHVLPMIWVSQEDLISEEEAKRLWDHKLELPLRFCLMSRLVKTKGIEILLEAAKDLPFQIDIYGKGPLEELCKNSPYVNYKGTVNYGKEFIETLQSYHALLLPSLSDEQPRILFDAFARAVPVIGSNTIGIGPNIEDGINGLLIPVGDANCLRERLCKISAPELRDMGMKALEKARGSTLDALHHKRASIIKDCYRSYAK